MCFMRLFSNAVKISLRVKTDINNVKNQLLHFKVIFYPGLESDCSQGDDICHHCWLWSSNKSHHDTFSSCHAASAWIMSVLLPLCSRSYSDNTIKDRPVMINEFQIYHFHFNQSFERMTTTDMYMFLLPATNIRYNRCTFKKKKKSCSW